MGDVEIVTYDPLDDKYLIYGRYGGSAGNRLVTPRSTEGIWGTRRRIYRAETANPLQWPEPELAFDPGIEANIDDEYYGFVSWRADEMHLGLLNILHLVDNTLDMYLLHSRDGRDWKRLVEHRPFIPRGEDGSYDQLDVETPNQPLEVGDELWFYYGGMNVHHDWWIWGVAEGIDLPETRDLSLAQNGHHLCLATMRLDGYVSLDATEREGWIETKPMFSTGAELLINGKCNKDGYIAVEILDNWGSKVQGYSRQNNELFTGDSVRHRVTWSGSSPVNEIPGSIKLRFHLRHAELYGFRFE